MPDKRSRHQLCRLSSYSVAHRISTVNPMPQRDDPRNIECVRKVQFSFINSHKYLLSHVIINAWRLPLEMVGGIPCVSLPYFLIKDLGPTIDYRLQLHGNLKTGVGLGGPPTQRRSRRPPVSLAGIRNIPLERRSNTAHWKRYRQRISLTGASAS